MGAMPIAMNFSVHAGSSVAEGSQYGFQLPVERNESQIGVIAAGVRGRFIAGLLGWFG
jgi:hypothetical protein